MFFYVEVVCFRAYTDWRKREQTEQRPFWEYSKVLHESRVDKWIEDTITAHDATYPDYNFEFKTWKTPKRLTVREAFDLYPEDFKLWCAENDLFIPLALKETLR